LNNFYISILLYFRGDSLGNLFVASEQRIFKISATTNIVTTYVGNPELGSSDENIAATSVLITSTKRIAGDSLGNLYYIDSNRIRKVLASSKLVSTVVGSGVSGYNGENTPALSTQFSSPHALWSDSNGNLIIGDEGNYRIRKWTVSTGLVTTIAGTGTQGFSDNRPAITAMFTSVYDIVGDTNGNIYFSDYDRVRKITSGFIFTFAGGVPCCTFLDYSPATSSFLYPAALRIDYWGDLYVSTYGRIVKVNAMSGYLGTVIGNGCYGNLGDGGPAFSACISYADGMWISSFSDDVYFSQDVYHVIRKVACNLNCITRFAGNGYYAFTGDGGPANNAQLEAPSGTFVDTNGNVYIADTNNGHIRLVTTAGIISSIGGSAYFYDSFGDNLPFSQSSLSLPSGIWKDTTGNLYISEIFRIRKVDASTNIITTIAGGGVSAVDNILATDYSFNALHGIWGDTINNIFVADRLGAVVKKLSLSSLFLISVAGSGVSGFLDNVPATSGQLYYPRGIWVDTIGRLFIADQINHSIRKVENGIITTFAGTGTPGFNSDGHLATATYLYNPFGVIGNSNGNIYFADSNNRIRMIYAVNNTANVVTTVVGSGSSNFVRGSNPVSAASLSYPVHVAVDTNGILYVTEGDKANTIRKTILAETPTSQPSRQPTSQPTKQPFGSPTAHPSRQPNGKPSSQPTLQPNSSPSSQPSIQPSTQPSCRPSSQPSVQPSSQPFSKPSRSPTQQPTGKPSTQPSVHPSTRPSSQPSGRPSTKPTQQPTAKPSTQPSVQPSSRPSSQPSGRPSRQPTGQPTSQPSTQPSEQPSTRPSSQPNGRPSRQPTSHPTSQPSTQPSEQPSVTPSSQPSGKPTKLPTNRPTGQPSSRPSSQPSSRPTKQPTSQPSGQPSQSPSSQPTCQPTKQPTVQPTDQPSGQPSSQPNSRPSSQPSSRPSCQPSGQPSLQPTGQPSGRPSAQPSRQPSQMPSCQPSGRPSGQPSSQPSRLPTNRPTNQPTMNPSSRPTSQPSVIPSSQPTILPTSQPSSCPSGKPSTIPSNRPTVQPTEQPSGRPSNEPSSQPSESPSSQPSSIPSNKPSSVPSSCPSDQPTSVPSSFPSGQPSSLPSKQPSSIPTNRPTCVPTSQPSGFPSSLPSSQPSVQPSSYPTVIPSSSPTFQPTVRIASELKEAITGFYNIKDSLNDKSGNGNNGKAHGGIGFTSDRFGSEKSSIEFDGNSGYIEVPTKNPDHLITNFTISFWIYPNISQLLPGTVVFDKSAYSTETCGWSLIYLRAHLFRFSYDVQHSRRRLALSANNSSSVLIEVPDNDWSHITLVKRLQGLLAYKDGYLVNSTNIPLSVSLPYSSLPLIIGTSKEILFRNKNFNNTSFYSGGLDAIFIYDRALSSGEITQLIEFAAPTSFPSAQPSSKPSTQPSSRPTTRPTYVPTSFPSGIPTRQPSGNPSRQPSGAPSRVPTDQPSSFPSCRPTNQPTSLPSGQPTVRPSSQPIGFPTGQPSVQPSSYPTSCPSTQPSRRPSSCPSTVPSMRPSAQPSSRPSQQPIGRPSSVPSSQPQSMPTMVPSVQPSSFPSNQPTSFPSTQPSSQPTKNRFHCTVTDNKFYSPIRDDCVPCPPHSFLNHTGDDTCYCNGGYSQVGLGLTVNCTLCSAGEVSFPGSSNCTQCQSGFFANSETNTCELCQVSFYSSGAGQTQCTPCPAGRATATLGSTSMDQCISPIPNFTLGFFALFLVIVIFSWYIVFGKFQRVSFERKVKIVTPNIEKCKQVLLSEEEFHYQHLIVVQDKKNKRTRKLNFFFFVVLSIVFMIVSVFFGFVFFTYQVFFTSLILWRGLEADLNLSPILTLLAEGLTDITEYISLPVNLFYYVALPFLYFFETLGTINLNLSSVNVSCSGSQAPIELLINCFILGLLVIVIRSDYQLLFNILLNNLNQRFLLNNVEQRLDAGNFRFSRYFFICLIVSALTSINPFQVGLRYCMGFVRIDTFGKNHGIAHEVTESCNQVPGAPHFDSFLGYMSTIFAWWLILPALYCLAEVVVPKCKKIDPLKKRIDQEKQSKKPVSKIFPADFLVDESVQKPSEDGKENNMDAPESDDQSESESDKSLQDIAESNSLRLPEFPKSLSSKFPGLDETVLAGFLQEAYRKGYKDRHEDDKERKQLSSHRTVTPFSTPTMIHRPSMFRKSIHKVNKKMPFLLAFYYYCKQKYLLMISIDLWVSNLFSSWITVLKKNTLKAARKEELLLLEQGGKQHRRLNRILSMKESSVKTPGVKQLFSLDSSEFIHGMQLYDLEQMKNQQKMDSLWQKERLQNDCRLPSYYELCLIVKDELHESILEPFNSIFALMGIGHFFTPTGRYYWKVVLNNYKIFLMVCLGIWTDEAVEAYGLEETSLNLSVDGRAFLYKPENTKTFTWQEREEGKVDSKNPNQIKSPSRSSPNRKFSAQILGFTIPQNLETDPEQNKSPKNKKKKIHSDSEKENLREVLPAIISVLICSRVILFQIIPSLVLFATVSMTLASFPLFIFNDFLIETLPPFMIYGEINREMAIEKELESFVALHPETKEVLSEEETIRVLSEEYSWRLSLRGIILFWNESRLLQFIQSSLTLFFSFLLLIYTRNLLVYLIVILAILFLFIITKSLVFLLYLGSSLDLKDMDIPKWLRPNPRKSFPAVVPEETDGVRIDNSSTNPVNLLDRSELEPEEEEVKLDNDSDDLDLSELSPSERNDHGEKGSASLPSSLNLSEQQSSSKAQNTGEMCLHGNEERTNEEEKRSHHNYDQNRKLNNDDDDEEETLSFASQSTHSLGEETEEDDSLLEDNSSEENSFFLEESSEEAVDVFSLSEESADIESGFQSAN
jgi:hypothetical protein